jgi:hypothetical protein
MNGTAADGRRELSDRARRVLDDGRAVVSQRSDDRIDAEGVAQEPANA